MKGDVAVSFYKIPAAQLDYEAELNPKHEFSDNNWFDKISNRTIKPSEPRWLVMREDGAREEV
jgi:hypothetical protein